jgi:hypothetical protein
LQAASYRAEEATNLWTHHRQDGNDHDHDQAMMNAYSTSPCPRRVARWCRFTMGDVMGLPSARRLAHGVLGPQFPGALLRDRTPGLW